MLVEKTQQVYHDYVVLKLFFTKPKYSIKERDFLLTRNIESNRKDYRYFLLMSTLFRSRKAMIEFFVTGFTENPNYWIGDFIEHSDELIPLHQKRMSRVRTLPTTFREDCRRCGLSGSEGERLKTLLFEDNPPRILFSGLSKESLAILDKLFGFASAGFNSDDLYWKQQSTVIFKYGKLLKIDDGKFETILNSTTSQEQRGVDIPAQINYTI